MRVAPIQPTEIEQAETIVRLMERIEEQAQTIRRHQEAEEEYDRTLALHVANEKYLEGRLELSEKALIRATLEKAGYRCTCGEEL